MSVVVVDVGGGRDPEALMRLAAGILRRESREADRITRVGPRRFQVLLPETREQAGSTYAERLRAARGTITRDPGAAAPDRLTAAVAGARDAETVPEALERAIRQLA